jgi:hypothetical protein
MCSLVSFPRDDRPTAEALIRTACPQLIDSDGDKA